jgi:hypothetical protein
MAPVYPDGSFSLKVPANTPFSFAPLDDRGRSFINKRVWLYVQPGEVVDKCIGCHEDRIVAQVPTNPDPIADHVTPSDLNIGPEGYTFITYRNEIGPIVRAKCQSCHVAGGAGGAAPAGGLDLAEMPDTTRLGRVFPRAYINLSGVNDPGRPNVTIPGFPRRSRLIDYALGMGAAAAQGPHPSSAPLSAREQRLFTFWVMLGAQYR